MTALVDVQPSAPGRDGRAVDHVGGRPFTVQVRSGEVEVSGPCRAVIHVSPPVPLGKVKRGVQAEVEGIGGVRLVRPHFGLRRAGRSIRIDGDGLGWSTRYRSMRHFEIVSDDGEVVMRRHGGRDRISSGLSDCEVALVLAILRSEVVDSSSLLSYLTV